LPAYHKLMVIGLDGGTWKVFDPLMAKGYMPFLAQLKKRSSYGILHSTIPPFTIPAWSTFVTGQNPGNHGIYSFFQHHPDDYNIDNVGEFVNSNLIGPVNLWTLLGNRGRKLIIVNVPLTYPPHKVNGVMITGMLTPPHSENFTYPAALKDQLGEYRIDLDNLRGKNGFRTHDRVDRIALISELIELMEIRKRTCLKLLDKYPYDFFMVVFTTTDRLLHYFTDLVFEDESLLSEKYSENELSELRKKLQVYLRTLDNSIKELVKRAGDSANVFVMSDHGFGRSPSRLFNVNCWLKQQHLLSEKSNGKDAFNPLTWIIRLSRSHFIRRITPGFLEKRIKSTMRGRFEELIDWSRTKAYYEPMYMNIGGITINEVGKKHHGIVAFGEKEALIRHITEELLRIEEEPGGAKVIEKVMRREELYEGESAEAFPDLILFARTAYACSNSLVETEVLRDHPQPNRPGDHRTEGMYLALGPDIRTDVRGESQKIVDLAPTFLYLQDVPLIDKFDGKVMSDLINGELLQQRRPVVESLASQPDTDGFAFNDEDDKELRERLKNLGYL
jgi:predicted AlkP superfamily phosphohydrolase/phosphomutase